MPFSSGTFTLVAGNPVVTGTTISSTWATNTLNDIANNGLSNCMLKDGTQTPTAAITMGGFRITNLGNATAVTDAARVSQVQNSSYNTLSSVSGVTTITGNAVPTPAAYAEGQAFRWISVGSNGPQPTLNVSGLGAAPIFIDGSTATSSVFSAKDVIEAIYISTSSATGFHVTGWSSFATPPDVLPIVKGSADATKKLRFEIDGQTTAVTRVLSPQDQDFRIGSVALRYISGLTLSTAGGSATMTIAAGQATDSTGVMMMTLASAISKTTSAWAVGTGNGGLDTGAIANSTWYKFFLIMRPDTGVVDVIFTTAALATGPSMPANYTLFRYIGSGKTDGSAQWVTFIQDGDMFEWAAPTNSVNTTNPGTSAVSATLNTPTGVNTLAWIGVLLNNVTNNNVNAYLSDLSVTDSAPDTSAFFSLLTGAAAATSISTADFYIRTNTSSQIRYRLNASGASDLIRITTKGWFDRRGANA